MQKTTARHSYSRPSRNRDGLHLWPFRGQPPSRIQPTAVEAPHRSRPKVPYDQDRSPPSLRPVGKLAGPREVQPMKAAIVGVGAMGRAMAGHIARAGHDVIAHDVSPERLEEAAADGLATAATLEEAAERSEVLIVVVVTDAQSAAVTEGIVKAGRPGSTIVIAATNHPQTMQVLAGEAEARGFRFVDAPVCFGLQGAREGRLVSLCGGATENVERIRPVLSAYSREVYHVGPVGTGQLAKTCNNMLHWAACVANYEVLLLAKRYGIDAQRMREILLDCPGQNGTLRDWDSTRFTWHQKDMDVALDLAQEGAVPLPLFGQVDQLVKRLGPDRVKELLYGPEASYLGAPVAPLKKDEGGLA
ncbi:MAG TPA: NAD(P)-dependent oxidoreductase [Afifellaceae bacterium]|nr:NAD(P)-dependent oxidoreductase [Afifellaceae bacterium]